MLISVVFSFRNEEANLPELLRRTCKSIQQLKGFRYELIFVNDNSIDRSLELLLDARKQDPNIKIINMSRCFGVSECVMAGIQRASGDLVVYMDADLQDPPELIPKLVDAWESNPGAEVVYTTRLQRDGESRFKLLFTKVGYWVLGKVSSVAIPPESGDFKLLTRRAVRELLRLKETKPFIRGMISWIGFKQVRVLYKREARYGGETKFPVLSRKVMYNFLDSALISFSDAPLKMTLLFGALVVLGSFVFILWVVVQKLIGWAIPGWSAIMATVLFLGGSQILMIGMVGLYLHAIFLESKGRPNFIVRDEVGFETSYHKTGSTRVDRGKNRPPELPV